MLKAWEHMELEKMKARESIEIEREKVRITKKSRIMLTDTSLMDDVAKE